MELEQLMQLPLNEEDAHIAETIIAQSKNEQVVVGVFGSFSVGKSLLLNKLVGRENLLPTHTNETTAVVTTLQYGDEDRIIAHYSDGTQKRLNSVQLHSVVAGADVGKIENIEIYLSSPSWLRDVKFIDTPGRNTKFQSHIEASEEAILQSHAAMYIMPWQGFTLEDIIYLKKLMMYQSNLYFIVNKVDHIDETQGISIEDLRQQVSKDIEAQLGKTFPVYMLSAKTGYNIDQLYTQFVPEITRNVELIKSNRFEHAIEQFLNRQQTLIENELNFLRLAISQDVVSIAAEKQKIELQYESIQEQVEEELSGMFAILENLKVEMGDFLSEKVSTMQSKVGQLVINHEKYSKEQLHLFIQDEVVSTRNLIFDTFMQRLDRVIGEQSNYKVNKLEGNTINLQFTEMSYKELTLEYERKKEDLLKEFTHKQENLQQVPEDDFTGRKEQIEAELTVLREKINVQYVPQYIFDENFNPKQAEKILRVVGFAGDVALAVGLAVATAGTSAALQGAGKAGAKVVSKEAGKKLAKEAVKNASKTTLKEIGKQTSKTLVNKMVVKQIDQKSDETNEVMDPNEVKKLEMKKAGLLEAARLLDTITSPVESLTGALGKAIDGSRSQYKSEDLEYRKRFYDEKFAIETEFSRKLKELNELAQNAQNNASLQQQIEKKRQQLEDNKQMNIQKIDKRAEEAIRKKEKEDFKHQITSQISKLLHEEKESYLLWIDAELNQVGRVLSQTLPAHYYGELQVWDERLKEIGSQIHSGYDETQKKVEKAQADLAYCKSLHKERVYAI